jgi:hypothetical protein
MAASHLNKTAKIYNRNIPKTKAKAMGISGNKIEKAKTQPHGKIIEQVSEFKHLGNVI